jgi:tetratricopeptide (TPR) repeat protein
MHADRFDKLTAEQAYFFRHAVVRDAAYALQLPAERARLHRFALAIIEAVHADDQRDPIAAELATHARHAQADGDRSLREAEQAYTWRAANHLRKNYSPDAIRWFDAAARLEADPLRRASALQDAAELLILTGHAADARPRLLEALQVAETHADLSFQSSLVYSLSLISRVLGREKDAWGLTERALELARAAGDPKVEASAVNGLAVLETAAGRREAAYELFKRALELTRKTGSRRGESVCLGNVAMYLFDCGRLDQALTACEQSLEVAREAGDRRSEGITCGMKGVILDKLDRLPEAISSFRQSLLLHEETYNRAYEAYDRCRMALLLLKSREETQARTEWIGGYEQMLAYGDKPDRSESLATMRAACARAGIEPFIATSGTG